MTGDWGLGFKRSCVLLGALCLVAGSAAGDPAKVKAVEAKAPIVVTNRPNLKTALFRRVRMTVPVNERIGELQDGMFCNTKGNFSMNQKLAQTVLGQFGRAWRSEATRAGYPRPGSDSVFEEKPATPPTADFDLGASVRAMQFNVCVRGNEIWGGVWFEVKWELYSNAARKVMYDSVTEGSYQNEGPERIRLEEFFERAAAVAVRGMLADPRFVDLMSGAVEIPAAAPLPPVAALTLRRGRAPEGGAQQNATLLRGSVVTIEGGGRSGSGFFVSREGHLLTNAHVVAGQRVVRVKLATGRELVGEVLKMDTARDVALIKTEGSGIEPLVIRHTDANVGEDVFALGSPLGDRFSGTLTRGILSGHRTLGERRFLQSDVAILPGSSGGPLLDSGGTVIGVTVAGLDAGRGNLNLFIPIREALEKLAIELRE